MRQRQLTASQADISRLRNVNLTFRSVRGGFRCNQAPHLGVLSNHRKNELIAKTAARPGFSRHVESTNRETAKVVKSPPRRTFTYTHQIYRCPYCELNQPHQTNGSHKCERCGLTHELKVISNSPYLSASGYFGPSVAGQAMSHRVQFDPGNILGDDDDLDEYDLDDEDLDEDDDLDDDDQDDEDLDEDWDEDWDDD
jgi:hypothetical protein